MQIRLIRLYLPLIFSFFDPISHFGPKFHFEYIIMKFYFYFCKLFCTVFKFFKMTDATESRCICCVLKAAKRCIVNVKIYPGEFKRIFLVAYITNALVMWIGNFDWIMPVEFRDWERVVVIFCHLIILTMEYALQAICEFVWFVHIVCDYSI